MRPSARMILCAVLWLAAVPGGVRGQDDVQKPGPGIVMPVVLREVKPDYTDEAKRERIQGTVEMGVVVKDDGTVGDVTVTRSLDAKYGLDEQAVAAMKKWRFRPGTKDGKPVPVRVFVEMTFTLK